MNRFFPRIFIDYSSFWAGAVIAIILIFFILRYRKKIISFLEKTWEMIISIRQKISLASDNEYTNILHQYIQGLHIISDLFPLNSILVPPKCIAPPPVIFPGGESGDPSLIQQSIGYDPLLANMAVEYFVPTFNLIDAVNQNHNICLVGLPGSGKTVAIADCITRLLTADPEENGLELKVPFYVKAHHILAQFPEKDILEIILRSLLQNPVLRTLSNLPGYLTTVINDGNAILFIDDLDQLTHNDVNRVANFITALCKKIPDLQVITAASPICLAGMVATPLQMISIAPWNEIQKKLYLKKWSKLWKENQSQIPSDGRDSISILDSMLIAGDHFSTPLEFSLKVLAVYAGDFNNPSPASVLGTYLRRSFLSQPKGMLRSLQTIALHSLEQEKSSFSRKDINRWFSGIKNDESLELTTDRIGSLTSALQFAYEEGLILRDGSDGFYFTHPSIAGYLAARGLRDTSPTVIKRILASASWSLLYETMRFLPAFIDIRPLVSSIKSDPSLFLANLLKAGAWLQHTKTNSAEEVYLLKRITAEIQNNPLFLNKTRLVWALVMSENPNSKDIFKHLLKSSDLDTCRAGAIGAGLIRDLSAVPQLISLLNEDFPLSTTACYALGKIGSPNSLEAIASGLLHGNELLRRASAEALAQNRHEGHPALREGAEMEDLMVRYAVVHGLSQINESWSLEILDKMRIDEKEWIVRDLAQQAYQSHQTGAGYLPKSQPPSYLNPWLDAFAKEHDLISPSTKNFLELLLKALDIGSEEHKLAALVYLAQEGSLNLIPDLKPYLTDQNSDIRQQAALTSWYLSPPNYHLTENG
jgi:hypothetical protein